MEYKNRRTHLVDRRALLFEAACYPLPEGCLVLLGSLFLLHRGLGGNVNLGKQKHKNSSVNPSIII